MPELDDLPLASWTSVIELIGPYAVKRDIGGGGTGRVLACHDSELGRDVAIKLLHEELLFDDVAVARFKREGQVLARIDSPNVVRVFQIGLHGKVPYIVMELVEGQDAEAALRQGGPFDLERAVTVGRDVARGLAAAHQAGVLHRDIKPSNILLPAAGAKLSDFGLAAPIKGSAQLTQVGTIPGTAATMAPERLRGVCDERTDIYALGCTLYALVAGRLPFEAGSAIEVLAAHANTPAPRLALDGPIGTRLAALVDQMLQKDPLERPMSAALVAQTLDDMLRPPAVAAAREELAEKLEAILGPDASVPELPRVPSIDELLPSLVAPAVAPAVAPEVTHASPAGLSVPTRAIAMVIGVVVLLGVAIALLGGDHSAAAARDASDVPRHLTRIQRGEAAAVRAELETLTKEEQLPVHALLRGHVLRAEGEHDKAFIAYRRAAKGGVVDAAALEAATIALNEEDATRAIRLLVSWPDADIDRRLQKIVADGGWWERHHAVSVLDKRGRIEIVDLTALGIRDLREGPTCNKRKHGLTLLKDSGAGPAALGAIEQAQRGGDNPCISAIEYDGARRAVASRRSTER